LHLSPSLVLLIRLSFNWLIWPAKGSSIRCRLAWEFVLAAG
jgi:hypothetical protein